MRRIKVFVGERTVAYLPPSKSIIDPSPDPITIAHSPWQLSNARCYHSTSSLLRHLNTCRFRIDGVTLNSNNFTAFRYRRFGIFPLRSGKPSVNVRKSMCEFHFLRRITATKGIRVYDISSKRMTLKNFSSDCCLLYRPINNPFDFALLVVNHFGALVPNDKTAFSSS